MKTYKIALAAVAVMVMIIASSCVVAEDDSWMTEVSTWEQMQAALNDEGCDTIVLKKDINTEAQITMRAGLTINGKSHTIKAVFEDTAKSILTISKDNCKVSNLIIDCNKHDGVTVTCSKGVTFSNAQIGNSGEGTCALTVDRSEVAITSQFRMANNGCGEFLLSPGDHIHLAWNGAESPVEKCSVTFDPDRMYPAYKYDGCNVAIHKTDTEAAGIQLSQWKEKFSVTDGGEEMCSHIYGDDTVIVNNGIAKVGDKRFASLNDAAAEAMSTGNKMELTQDCVDEGIVTGDAHGVLDIDFGGFKYTIGTPFGVPRTMNVSKYIELGEGGKVTISDGTIWNASSECSLIVDTVCDLELVDIRFEADSLTEGHDPHHSDYAYAVSVRGGTTVFRGGEVVTAKSYDPQHSVAVRGSGATVKVYDELRLNGNFDMTVDSASLEVFGRLIIEYEGLGRDYHIAFGGGTITIRDGAYFDAEVMTADNNVRLATMRSVGDTTITSSPFKVTGHIVGTDEVRCSVLIFSLGADGTPASLDMIVEKGHVSLMGDASIDGDLVILKDSELTVGESRKFVTGKEGHLILMEGCTYEGKTLAATRVMSVGTDGTMTEQTRAQFVFAEHVTGFTYDGKDVSYIENAKTVGGLTIDLSKLSVKVDGGYILKGWDVNGVRYSSVDTVTITDNAYVVPVLEQSSNAMMISAVVLVVLLLIGLGVIVARRK